MASPSIEAIDPVPTLERLPGNASSRLQRAALAIGADAVAVLLAEASQVEIPYFWSRANSASASRKILNSRRELLERIGTRPVVIEAGSTVARILRDSISPLSQSFLLFPWKLQQRAVVILFGYATPQPSHDRLPEAVEEDLQLVGLAVWSVKEIASLRAELKVVNDKLARRKLIERAKGVLQDQRGLTEKQAYEFMRNASRRRRITLPTLAEELLRVPPTERPLWGPPS